MKKKLITRNFCFILIANFLLFSGFYLILPVLPFYLKEVFDISNGTVGMVLSCYTIAALCVRPFSGYLLDTFSRKPLYLLTYGIFAIIFAGYSVAAYLLAFIILRMMHGFAFGMVTVAGNTIVIDITPSSRRGEAVGYYGLTNNIAMSIGPMAGLFMHGIYPMDTIFSCAMVLSGIGFIMACLVKTPPKAPVEHEPMSLDRFILLKGIPGGISLLLVSISYGMTTTYVAIYAKEIGITLSTGIFFTFMAVGMAISRIFSGKQVDKGRTTQAITLGLLLLIFCYFSLSVCELSIRNYPQFTEVFFFLISLMLGIGFGTIFPAFNSLFISLAPNNKRGTATSTYLTAWDIGIGSGLVIGGYVAEHTSFGMAYFTGACLIIVSVLFFSLKVSPHYHKNKLS
ncbi:Tetracycline resistance protein class B [termite gut metagenome]|uniref:Tetracycline resistance protein class B n=1 Tax=termite gut metagenome TaxID=433724 RepID=A0A5J4R593_9ZZZZ